MMTEKQLNAITRSMRRKPAVKKAARVPAVKQKLAPVNDAPKVVSIDDDDFVPVGLSGVMAATEKLLAVNRGLTEPDERDSYGFKQIFSVDRHLGERIRLDAGKLRRGLLRSASRFKTLKGAYPGMFDPYSVGLLLGDPQQSNPLSAPLEEINTMHILEQARRITQMGPGGIGTSEAITEEAQSVHPSQFGFVSAIESPESERVGIDARLSWGSRLGSDGRIYQQFRNKKTDQMEWLTPEDVESRTVGIPD